MHSVLNKLFLIILLCFGILHCKQPNETRKGFVEVADKSKIEYQIQGSGDTTLFFIHGWCINKEYWSNQFDYFSKKYTVIAIDLPGSGASSKERSDWDFNQYANDIHEVISQLHLKKVILIGHSMSGDIILKADNLFPESMIGLIGIDNLHSPTGPIDSAEHAQAVAYFDHMEKDFDSTVIKEAKANLFQASTPDSIVQRVMKDILTTNHKLAVDILRALFEISRTEKLMESKLAHTLCLVNSDVNPVQMDSLVKYCAKGVKVYTVHATGHYPMIERPLEFNVALQKAIWKQ
ncbi:MAG: alpha/beta hydrolase [Saprospiraceae bacterium]